MKGASAAKLETEKAMAPPQTRVSATGFDLPSTPAAGGTVKVLEARCFALCIDYVLTRLVNIGLNGKHPKRTKELTNHPARHSAHSLQLLQHSNRRWPLEHQTNLKKG